MGQHICRTAVAAVLATGLLLTACSSSADSPDDGYTKAVQDTTEFEEYTAVTTAEYGAEDFFKGEKQTQKPKETQPVSEEAAVETESAAQVQTEAPAVNNVTEPAVSTEAPTEHVHNYIGKAKVKATEYAPGIMMYQCSSCSKSYEERYALPHTIDIGGGKESVVYGYWDKTSSNELMKLLNEYRKQKGLDALNDDAGLENTARLRAVECSYLFSHTRPNSGRCFTLYPDGYKAVAENIASGYNNAAETIEAWKKSDKHNKNMLSTDYNYACAGVFIVLDNTSSDNGNILYVQSFMKK